IKPPQAYTNLNKKFKFNFLTNPKKQPIQKNKNRNNKNKKSNKFICKMIYIKMTKKKAQRTNGGERPPQKSKN
ncbi:hypothetical protein LXA28_18580, partial [Erwinia amylovora]|uniref:hypothetical protein n=1 Tax=Erwinia amylovora TaxID=552 RepID=UPI0020C00C1C